MESRSERCHELGGDAAELRGRLEKQSALVDSLEVDLLRVNALPRTPGEGESSSPDAQSALEWITGEDASAVEKCKTNEADSLLPIVASQRERFRLRVQQLEEVAVGARVSAMGALLQQGLQYQQQMALLQTELERMRGDNVKLYQKIRFLQSYQGGQKARADDVEGRYARQYEASLDPFRRFNMEERQRSYASLRAHDKATLGIGRWLLSNSQTRALFFAYLLFVHCLVFAVLYKLASTESCKRDFASDCVQKFQEHMQAAHGSET